MPGPTRPVNHSAMSTIAPTAVEAARGRKYNEAGSSLRHSMNEGE